ncbi:MAG: hypothetical protein OHK0053_08250 [Microscillaceae bacterium]
MKDHEDFFKKALEIQAQKREKLSEAEKKEIAEQLGFSEAEWQAVLDSFAAHFERGSEFLKRNNYEKAIAELEEALMIQPEHAPTLAALAKAYLGVFQTKKRSTQKEKALQYAQECLQYETKNEAAHQVIDFFNPNQIQTSKPNKPSSSKPSHPKHTTTKDLPTLVVILMFGSIFLFWIYNDWYLPSLKNKKYNAKTSKLSSEHNTRKQTQQASYTVTNLKPLPFALQTLPKHLAQKYQIIQKDSLTWQVSTQSKAPLLELKLVENALWHPHYSDEKKKTALYADLKFEVKTLCDSIRFDALFFTFQLQDERGQILHQEDSVFLEQHSSYDRFMYFPKDYFFRKGESSALYFRYATKETGRQDIGKDSALLRAKVVLDIQSLKTAQTPVYREKLIEVKSPDPYLQKTIDQYIELSELKEGFMEDPGSPYHIHFWALKIRNKHPEQVLKALGITVRYYDKNKELIAEGGDWLIHNLTAPLAAGADSIYKLRTHLGENTYKSPSAVIEPKDIAYKEVEFHGLKWQ